MLLTKTIWQHQSLLRKLIRKVNHQEKVVFPRSKVTLSKKANKSKLKHQEKKIRDRKAQIANPLKKRNQSFD